MRHLLLIPRIQVQNANALSSPYTIGFPAMTAWLGGVHALQRRLNQNGYEKLRFTSTAVCCHHIDLRTYKGRGDFHYSIIGTGNPLDKEGERPAFIEEARCHLNVSLLVEYEGLGLDLDEFNDTITKVLHSGYKLASGDVLAFKTPVHVTVEDDKELRDAMRKLMPGYVIIERRDLMSEAMEQGQDALDALLDYLKVMHRSETDEQGKSGWTSRRKIPGWIVPIAVGFHGITPLGKAEHQRDPNTPHRFAESVVTLGQFVMPYQIENIDNVLWHYHADIENSLYLCQQNKPSTNY